MGVKKVSRWTPLRDLSWTSPPLGSMMRSRAFMESRFGKPMLVDVDSHGLGLFDAWLMRFSCGLEVAVWIFHQGADWQLISNRDEPANIEVYANESAAGHIAFHLGFDREDLEWTPEADDSRSWRVRRQDDNGNEYEVTRVTSACEAESIVAAFQARGHKQTYWVD